MTEVEIAIILLTAIVSILTIVVLVLLVLVVVTLVKLNRVATKAQEVSENLAAATAWLSPTTVFAAAVRAFRNK